MKIQIHKLYKDRYRFMHLKVLLRCPCSIPLSGHCEPIYKYTDHTLNMPNLQLGLCELFGQQTSFVT